eukprot:scaffold14063_cov66-Cylindrotheca_fusiformis.AAC.1
MRIQWMNNNNHHHQATRTPLILVSGMLRDGCSTKTTPSMHQQQWNGTIIGCVKCEEQDDSDMRDGEGQELGDFWQAENIINNHG